MWKSILVLSSLVIQSLSISQDNIPVLLWAPHNQMFSSTPVGLSLTSQDVATTFQDISSLNRKEHKWGILSKAATEEFPPAAFVVFMMDNLRVDQVSELKGNSAESFVESSLTSAASSSVISHTTRRTPLLSTLSVKKEFNADDIDTIKAFLASDEGQTMMREGNVDLIVVNIASKHSLGEADKLIKEITALFDGCVFGLTANGVQNDNEARRLQQTNIKKDKFICADGYFWNEKTATCFSHYVYITPEILAGLVTGLFFLSAAYVGVSCLNSIQTPLRYPSKAPPKGKEF